MLNQRQQDSKCGTSQSFKNLLLKNKHVHTPNHKHTNVTMGMPKALSCRVWLFLSQHDTGIHRLDTYTHAKSSLTQSTVICSQTYSVTPVHSNIYTHPHVRLQYACKSLPTEFSCFFPSTAHAYIDLYVHELEYAVQHACQTCSHAECPCFFLIMAHVHRFEYKFSCQKCSHTEHCCLFLSMAHIHRFKYALSCQKLSQAEHCCFFLNTEHGIHRP